MKILGIETSCDETAAAVVEDGSRILSNVVVSQIDIFAEYGGVIPEVAARSHLEVMMPVISKALEDASSTWDDIDAIAVTYAPGLLGSLLIGTLTARTLAILHDKPLYAVHHLKSHVYANWLNGNETMLPSFPVLALVISGGHTQILYMPAHNEFEIIGTTHDDAVGECFDKVAKILGLPYPGGPSIAKAALGGDPDKYKLPHPKVEGLDFSFSGLKTAVLRAVQKELGLPISHPSYDLKNHLTPQQIADFAASFQKTAVLILCEKLSLALSKYPDVQSVVVAGGVSANQALREALPEAYFPERSLSGDNGAMVAAACYYEIKSGVKPVDPYKLNIYPRISIES
ncbi:tRNA (adenosine(37)-N6)-threonylcarbamoyltransferase complex transferase subunit TsaD [Candidatus Saccharibacteria bacterium]|nr:tRNA (adenosine(37)-N6)-threonylcarbamoyltransferase complex transferase subunit TsaD [Candidatus Saccharibacteria bacterium]